MKSIKAIKENILYTFKKYSIAYIFIAPVALAMLIMHLFPILQSFYMSTLQLDATTLQRYLGAPFVGINNFYDILIHPDSPMRIGLDDAIRNTVYYTIVVTIGQTALGLIVALMLNYEFKGRSFVRTLFLFSWIVPTYVTGILWGFMWQQSIGIMNIILYDWCKLHLIFSFLNRIIVFLHLDFIIKAINSVIDSVYSSISFLNFGINQLVPISSFITLFVNLGFKILLIFGVYHLIRFIFFNLKKFSSRLSKWFVFILIFFLVLGVYNILIPTSFDQTFKPAWLVGTKTFWAIVIPTIWRFWPFSMLMLMAGLQNIPSSLYDAAKIDGASKWKSFWKITWPMLQPVWMILILYGMIYNVYSFNIVSMMFGNGAGFPGKYGDLLMTNIFRNSFNRWEFGSGAAATVVLLLFMIVMVNIWYKFYKKTEEMF